MRIVKILILTWPKSSSANKQSFWLNYFNNFLSQPQQPFKSFQAVKPPEFPRNQDPVEAHPWLKEVEKLFALLNVNWEQNVGFATYFLRVKLSYWWESARTLETIEIITLDRFKKIFLDKYFPRYMQTQMELRFFDLKQENITIADNKKKITKLARFVSDYVDIDEKKAKRFQQ